MLPLNEFLQETLLFNNDPRLEHFFIKSSDEDEINDPAYVRRAMIRSGRLFRYGSLLVESVISPATGLWIMSGSPHTSDGGTGVESWLEAGAYLFEFLVLAVNTFIGGCCLGTIRTRAPVLHRRRVSV